MVGLQQRAHISIAVGTELVSNFFDDAHGLLSFFIPNDGSFPCAMMTPVRFAVSRSNAAFMSVSVLRRHAVGDPTVRKAMARRASLPPTCIALTRLLSRPKRRTPS